MTSLVFLPDQNLTIAVLCNITPTNPERISQDLAAILFGEPDERPFLPDAVMVSPSTYKRYLCTYQVAPEF